MKTKFYVLLAMSMMSSLAYSGQEKGGGDICEDRIQEIRNDIKAWIQKDGHQSLYLPAAVTTSQYAESMLSEMKLSKIRCVAAGDEGHPVEVYGTPKVCRFDKESKGNLFKKGSARSITCDFKKFMELSDDDQYKLVHHEYAGLADIEIPLEDDSNYDVSNQLTKYLQKETVTRLSILPRKTQSLPYGNYSLTAMPVGTEIEFAIDAVVVSSYDYAFIDLGGYKIDRYRELQCKLKVSAGAAPKVLRGNVKFVVDSVQSNSGYSSFSIKDGSGTSLDGKPFSRFHYILCSYSGDGISLNEFNKLVMSIGGTLKLGAYETP